MTASPPPVLPAEVPSPEVSPEVGASPSLALALNRLQPSPETVVLLLAIAIGTSTGLAVVLFRLLIDAIQGWMFVDLLGLLHPLGAWTLLWIPVLGALLVGMIRWRWPELGPSLSSLLANPKELGKTSPLRAGVKAIAAAISLGTGASLGPEGPSVEIGANIGIFLAQSLQVSQERLKLLLGAGAAAGLAAGFNAPIAGVFFALEVVLGTTFATSAVSLVLLAAVVSAFIAQVGQGGQPPFSLPAYEVRSPLELPLYLGLGLCASVVSIAYKQAIQLSQHFFQGALPGFRGMAAVPVGLRPLLGAVCVGLLALKFPQALGIGYETVEAVLRDVQFSLPLLAGLLLAKLAMTAISLGSGFVGGLFAPAMFLGASLGAAYGKVLTLILPTAHLIAAPPAYAMVGMAAVLASSARAPLTAILLLFELTRDYRIILPLMAAVGLSVWLVDRLSPLATKTAPQLTLGLNLQPDPLAEILHRLTVAQVMQPTVLSLPSTASVLQAGIALTAAQSRSAIVLDQAQHLMGIVTLQDINRAIARLEQSNPKFPFVPPPNLTQQTLQDICTKDLLLADPNELVATALDRMAARGLGQLPVIAPQDPHRVLGLLDRDHIPLAGNLSILQESLRPYLTSPPLAESRPIPLGKQST
jgi:H+/Cl- antiporter ClcA/CBS domain-containing protein